MSYQKTTIISGTDIPQRNPWSAQSLGRPPAGEEVDKCSAWQKAHHHNTALNGHWKPETAFRHAKKRGWYNVQMEHLTSDLSGHGRGSMDGRYEFDEDGLVYKTKAYEDVDDSQDVHDLYDDLDPTQ